MNALGLDVDRGRQPRVRRGLQGAAADGRRRLHRRRSGRREQPELLRLHGTFRARTSRTSRPTSSTRAPTRRSCRPTRIKNIKGAKIGFIGMTLKDTPSIVTAAGVAGLEFTDEVATANALVPVLQGKQGVNAIVVLIHQGGTPGQQTWTGPRRQAVHGQPVLRRRVRPSGVAAAPADSPIIPIAKGLDPAIDMVVSGHTHQPYVCDIPDPAGQARLVTSASSFGRLFTETDLTYDRRTQDIVRASVEGCQHDGRRATSPRTRRRRSSIADYNSSSRRSPARSSARSRRRRHRATGNTGRGVGRSATSSPTPSSTTRSVVAPVLEAGDRVHEPGRHPRRPQLRGRPSGARRRVT